MPKLPKFEDWKAPWEEADEEPDAEKLKKHLYNLLSDKEKANEARDKAKADLKTATEARDELQKSIDEKAREGETEVQRLERELKATQKRLEDKADVESPEVIRLRVALDKGLTERQAARLSGTTKEELEADAESYLEELGAKSSDDGDKNNDGTGDGSRRTPRDKHNPGDRGGSDQDTISTKDALDLIPRTF